jgi:cytoskeletal protein RodZ
MKDLRYLILYLIVVVASGLILAFARLHASASEGTVSAQPAQQPASIASPSASPASSPVAAATKSTEQWIADAASGDAGVRAAAITALADAPRAEALPVLGRILESGDPQADRPQALISLRDLALNQGDDDGAIRDAIRHVIYHGDDFTKAEDAQEALDVIEESLQGQ